MKVSFRDLIGSLLVLFIFMTVLPVGAFANDQENIGFTVESIQPNTQVDKSMSLYYFSVEPSTHQTIKLKIISQQKQRKKVSITVTDAITNKNGNIDYGQESPDLDESLDDPISSFVKVKKGMETISVENFEEKIIELEVNPPKSKFEGVKLGAVRIIAEDDDSKKGTITNKYGYTIALMVTEDNNDYKTGGDIRLKKVWPGIEDGKKIVKLPIQNYLPKVIKNVAISGFITKKDSKRKLTSKEIEAADFAPNSVLPFNISLGLESLSPGIYTVHVKAKQNERNWSWKQDFEITEATANKMNKQATFKLVLLPIIKKLACILIAAVILVVFLLMMRHKKWKRELRESD